VIVSGPAAERGFRSAGLRLFRPGGTESASFRKITIKTAAPRENSCGVIFYGTNSFLWLYVPALFFGCIFCIVEFFSGILRLPFLHGCMFQPHFAVVFFMRHRFLWNESGFIPFGSCMFRLHSSRILRRLFLHGVFPSGISYTAAFFMRRRKGPRLDKDVRRTPCTAALAPICRPRVRSPLYGIQKGAAFPLWFLIQKNASRMEGVFY
jgi:hypothetical protein